MVSSTKAKNNARKWASFLIILLAMAAISYVIIPEADVVATKSSSRSSITQIPSEGLDFPDNQSSALQLSFVKANKDIAKWYHVKGEVVNSSPDTISGLNIRVKWYDENMNVVGVGEGFATPYAIEPGRSASFDTLTDPKSMDAKPKFFKLSFDWQ
jgi:hypothetical protein